MVCLPEYKAGKAEVCEVDRVTDVGPGHQYYVRLPDGSLVDCGIDKDRAKFIRDAVNVVMKWSSLYPPCGVIESVVKNNYRDETRYYSDTEGQE